jgi:hypothetical protein
MLFVDAAACGAAHTATTDNACIPANANASRRSPGWRIHQYRSAVMD